ncbi:hypothetical protein MRX96_038940 [Rhipicephalus microplus]
MGTFSGLKGSNVGGGSGGKLFSSNPENAGSSFSVFCACVGTSCSSLAGCDKFQESRVDSGESDSWPLDSSSSPSELVLLVSSPASEPVFKGVGVTDTVRASSVTRGSSNFQWSGTFAVVWGRVLGLRP